MAGMRLTTDYQQDVFAENDYSSVTGADRRKQPTLQPPVDGAGRPYLVSEAVGTLSGPARFYRRTDTQAVQQGQATAHARVHDIAAVRRPLLRPAGLVRVRLPVRQRRNQYRGVKYTGVVDLFRIPKPGAAIYQAQVDPRVAGHRARVLLGLRPVPRRSAPAERDDLRQPGPAGGVRRRRRASRP